MGVNLLKLRLHALVLMDLTAQIRMPVREVAALHTRKAPRLVQAQAYRG